METGSIWSSLEKIFNTPEFLLTCFMELFGKVSSLMLFRDNVAWWKHNNITEHCLYGPHTFGWVQCYSLLSLRLNLIIVFYLFIFICQCFIWSEIPGSQSEGRREAKHRRRVVSKYKMMYDQAGHFFTKKYSHLLMSWGIFWEAV